MRYFKMSDGKLLLFPVVGIFSLVLAFGTQYLSSKGKVFSVIGAGFLLFSSLFLIRGSFTESATLKKSIGKKKLVLYFLLSSGMFLVMIASVM